MQWDYPPIGLILSALNTNVLIILEGSLDLFQPPYVQFALSLWYAAKTIPTLLESSLYLSRVSSNYFSGDINLLHVTKYGIEV